VQDRVRGARAQPALVGLILSGPLRRLTALDRLGLGTVLVAAFISVGGSCVIGSPGPEPGWTTYTHEGLKIALPSSWTVSRQYPFDPRNTFSGVAPVRSADGSAASISVNARSAIGAASVAEEADIEAFTLAERCPSAEPLRGAVHVSEAAIPGGRGLMVEGLCAQSGMWRVTQFVRAGNSLYTVKLQIPDGDAASEAGTLRLILDRLRF
jgi:hypothetical protein